MFYLINFLLFIFLSFAYYFSSLSTPEMNEVFLTISTFLFSIFAGFFISRQGGRYSIIREQIAKMDGEISNIYRHFQHFGKEAQEKAKNIIKKDYDIILRKHNWDYNFAKKSTTITSLHELISDISKNKKNTDVQKQAIERIMQSLASLQVIRKMMIVLRQEIIPKFQWILLIALAIILFITVSLIPSYLNLIGAILKGAFASSILFVFILLKKLNKLELFEKTVGEESAQDVVDIFKGKK